MRYLLDTHAILWFFLDSWQLSEVAAQIMQDLDAQKCISIASIWEFAIKLSIGKLQFDGGLPQFWRMVNENGIDILPITLPYLLSMSTLPFHHRDPFDRLIVASAKTDNLRILTADDNIRKYDVETLW